jgi:hypothetical protein
LAKCTLDLSHPYFKKALLVFQDDSTFAEGLEILKQKVEAEHTCCHWNVQPMKGYPDCQGKIWKYDWAPPGDRSAGRKSWRMVVIVPDPLTKPYRLIAATVYAKSQTSQLSIRELAKILASITSPEIAAGEQTIPELFKHVIQDDGQTRSLCLGCCEAVAISFDIQAIEEIQRKHKCDESQLELFATGKA